MTRSKTPLLALLAGAGVLLLAAGFVLGFVLPHVIGRVRSRPNEARAAASVTPEQLRTALAAELRLRGTAVSESHTETLGLSSSTYQRWRLDTVLKNATPYGLALGNDLFLVEANPEASVVDGIGYFRGQKTARPLSFADDSFATASEWSFHYPFSNYVRSFGDGSRFSRQGGRMTLQTVSHASGRRPDSSAEPSDFGRLAPGAEAPIRLTLDEGTWLRPEILASVRVVLPQISVATTRGVERFRLTVYFARPATNTRQWSAARHELTWLDAAELTRAIEPVEANPVSRLFAANWLAERDRNKAGPVLARACRPLDQGEFLAAGLGLLTDLGAPDLAEHALRLLGDGRAPNGIRHRAAVYLGTIRHEPALPALVAALKEKDDAVAEGAIEGLGGLGGAKAAETLFGLLRAKVKPGRDALATTAFLRAGGATAVPALQEMARSGREAAFDALVKAARPDCFDYFAALARDRRHRQWRDRVLGALARSGGSRALPVLLDLLATDPAPSRDQATSSDALVEAILGADPAPVRADLARLARAGNLRALQVLAGWNDGAARDVLLELARSADGTARLIALDGVAQSWSKEGREVLRAAAAGSDAELARTAAVGLGNTGDAREVGFLLPPLRHSDSGVRHAAASAIGDLGPGEHQAEVLQAILQADDRELAATLVDGLIAHGWRDRSTRQRIASRLSAAPEDVRYELVRLLRHLSGNAMGPESYSEWAGEPERWVKRWRDWATKA